MAISVGSVFMECKLESGGFKKEIYSVWGLSETAFGDIARLNSNAFIPASVINLARQAGISFKGMDNDAKESLGGITTFLRGTFTTNWTSAWNSVVDRFSSIWRTCVNQFIHMMNTMVNAVNGVLRGFNSIRMDVPSFLGGGSFGFNVPLIPNIPMLAKGGIVTAPTLAMVGEAGREAVLPLQNNTAWMDDLAYRLAAAMERGGADRRGGTGVVSLNIDGVKFAEAVIDDFERVSRRRGL
jgi:hypothetical protein